MGKQEKLNSLICHALEKSWVGAVEPAFGKYLLRVPLSGTGAKLSFLASVVLSCVLVYTLWEPQLERGLFLWCGVVVTVSGLSLIHHLKNKKYPLHNALVTVTVFEVTKGLMWLIPVFYFYPDHPFELKIFFVLILVGYALSAAIARFSIFPVTLGSIGASLPATAILLFLAPDRSSFHLGMVALMGWLCAIYGSYIFKKNLISRQFLIYQKDALVSNVEEKVLELDRMRLSEQEARCEADQANLAKSRFLAQSSHDLRQPLHAINLLLESIPKANLPQETTATLSRVQQSLDSLTGLFDSLLDMTLLDTGKVEVRKTGFSLRLFLQQAVSEFMEIALLNNVQLSHVPSSVILNTDPEILRRMVQNLIANAIQHSHGRRVLIGARRKNGKISIEVHDTGDGIPANQQDQIFREFTRLSTEAASTSPGLGLGLAIVQRLASVINLKVEVSSDEGKGSVFSINNIDYSTYSAINKLSDQAPVMPHHVGMKRVAIIDDDRDVLTATSQILNKWGYKADSYTEYCKKSFLVPDVVLCDYELAGPSNGIDIIHQIKSSTNKELAAILITGNKSESVAARASRASLPVLYKPVRPAQLRSALLVVGAASGKV